MVLDFRWMRGILARAQDGTLEDLTRNRLHCCRYLVKFLSKLAQDSEVNKMTPSNIAIVLGPNLLWAKTEG